MLKEIIHLDNEEEARRILARRGNGIPQIEAFILEWKAAREEVKPIFPTIVQKVVTSTKIDKEVEVPTQDKVIDSE